MAFEVARVHSLICSSIKDECDLKNGKRQSPSRECITEQAQDDVHLSKDLPCDSNVFNQWSESSPLEASSCFTTEAGSDEEYDLFAGLAQQIAHSMLEDEKNGTESGAGGGSRRLEPQGFLDVLEVDKVNDSSPSSWSGGSWSSSPLCSGSTTSSKGSSRVSSQVSSPPTTPSSGHQDAWDTLYAAAGEVVRLRCNEEKNSVAYPAGKCYHTQVPNQFRQNHLPVQVRPAEQTGKSSSPYSGRRNEELKCSSNQVHHFRPTKSPLTAWTSQSRTNRLQHQQQLQGWSLDGHNVGHSQYYSGKVADCSSVQWTSGSAGNVGFGMQAMFLGGGSGRESGGTGVFLPRSLQSASESMQKTGSDYLVRQWAPFCSSPSGHSISASPNHGHVRGAQSTESPKVTIRETSWPTPQNNTNFSSLRPQAAARELCLPTEWTY